MSDARLTMMEAWGKLFRAFVALADDDSLDERVREVSAVQILFLMTEIDKEMRALAHSAVANRAFDHIQHSIMERTLKTDEQMRIFRNWKNISEGNRREN